MDRPSREKINKDTQDLNDTIDCVCAKSLQPSPTLYGTLYGHLTLSGLSIDGSDLGKSFRMMTF